jgi:hypothetical protein
MRSIDRREFLVGAVMLAGGTVAAACLLFTLDKTLRCTRSCTVK